MDIKTLIDEYNLENEVIVLEPQEDFNKGIIGVSEDKKHIIYGYKKLTFALAQSYKETEKNEEKTDEDYLFEACEWVDYNTIRSLPHMNQEYVPIIIYEVE